MSEIALLYAAAFVGVALVISLYVYFGTKEFLKELKELEEWLKRR